MNRWPTCDDVFDRLTRGPFPASEPGDAAIESHLMACHECRELAEALRPAVRLFEDAYEPNVLDGSVDPRTELPVYRGGPAIAAAAVRPRLSSRSPVTAAEASWAWQLAAAALLGVALGAAAAGGWFTPSASGAAASPFTLSGRVAGLHSLPLKEACLRSHPSADGLGAPGTVRCCTLCHHAHEPDAHHPSPKPRTPEVASLQLACAICHTP